MAFWLASQEFTKVSQINWEIILGFKALPWLKSVLLAGWNESSLRLSKPGPKTMVGFVHLLKLAVLARAALPGPPPGAAGTLAKSVLKPRAALKISAWAPPCLSWAAVAPDRQALTLAAGALHLSARMSHIALNTIWALRALP